MSAQDIIAIVVVSIVVIIYLLIEYEMITADMFKKGGKKHRIQYLR
jgi:hypothetical protein